MIGYLRGKVVYRSPERVVLDVGGVGYELHVPVSTFYEIERAEAAAAAGKGDGGGEIALYVHTHVREDALALFGFWSEREKVLFEKLIAVSGIGPKLARVVLSGMSPDDLIASLAGKDAKALATIPGVGKKTAERMVLELAEKVAEMAAQIPGGTVGGEGGEDVVSALVNLGYKRAQAEKVVGLVRRERGVAEAGEGDGEEFAELLRESLRRLSRA